MRNEGNSGNNKRYEQNGMGKNNRGGAYQNRVENYKQYNSKGIYKKKQNGEVNNKQPIEKGKEIEKDKESGNAKCSKNSLGNKKNGENVGKASGSTSCSNSFALLDSIADTYDLIIPCIDRDKLNAYLKNNSTPMEDVLKSWSPEMQRYYKEKKELMGANDFESKDVVESKDSSNNAVLRNEVEGIRGNLLV